MKETKEKLLQTATELFSKRGIDGVSTRDLAKASGVNLCSINYYFGTKQKLYEAILENVVEKIVSLVTDRQISLQNQGLSALEEIKAFAGNLLDLLCSDTISSIQAELLIKEIINPTAAYDKLYLQVIEPLHKRLTSLVMQLTGVSEQEAIIKTHCIMGQAVMFRIHKEALLRRLGTEKYTPELVAEIRKQVLTNCEVILTGGRK